MDSLDERIMLSHSPGLSFTDPPPNPATPAQVYAQQGNPQAWNASPVRTSAPSVAGRFGPGMFANDQGGAPVWSSDDHVVNVFQTAWSSEPITQPAVHADSMTVTASDSDAGQPTARISVTVVSQSSSQFVMPSVRTTPTVFRPTTENVTSPDGLDPTAASPPGVVVIVASSPALSPDTPGTRAAPNPTAGLKISVQPIGPNPLVSNSVTAPTKPPGESTGVPTEAVVTPGSVALRLAPSGTATASQGDAPVEALPTHGAGLISQLFPFDRAALDESVSRFLGRFGDESTPALGPDGPSPYPYAFVTTVVVVEAARRWRERLSASEATAEWKKGSPSLHGLS